MGLPLSSERDSFAYMGHDSWLVDFESRLAAFRKAFGIKNVVAVDYDRELRTNGNVIPSFLNILGVERHFNANVWRGVFVNRSQDSRPLGSSHVGNVNPSALRDRRLELHITPVPDQPVLDAMPQFENSRPVRIPDGRQIGNAVMAIGHKKGSGPLQRGF